MTKYFDIALLILLLSLNAAPRESYRGYKLIGLNDAVEDSRARENIGKLFGQFGHVIDPLSHRELLIDPWNFPDITQFLKEWQINYQVLSQDVQEILDKEKKKTVKRKRRRHLKRSPELDPITCSGYYLGDLAPVYEGWRKNVPNLIHHKFLNYCQTKMWLKMMEDERPNEMEVFNYGRSYEGRDLLAVRIPPEKTKNKVVILIEGGAHAREWGAISSVLCFILKLTDLFKAGRNHTLQQYQFIIVPIANPDGYEYSHNENRLWRKTRSATIDVECFGVDLNRNFNSHWYLCDKPRPSFTPEGCYRNYSSYCKSYKDSRFCSNLYKGKHPQSEPETRALSRLAWSYKNRLKVYISVHTYGQLWLLPYGFSSKIKPPGHDDSKRAAQAARRRIYSEFGVNYTVGNIVETIEYKACGSSVDWAIERLGITYSYGVEMTMPKDKPLSIFRLEVDEIEREGDILFSGVEGVIEEIEVIDKEKRIENERKKEREKRERKRE